MFHRETATYKRSYYEDMALYPTPLPRYTVGVLLVVGLLLFPLLASDYITQLANLVGIAALGAIGLNILVGYTGQISIGQGGFMSVGAYSAALITTKLGMPWPIALIAGGCASALVGVGFGIPSLRIKGLYLAIATLAAQLIIEWTINHLPASVISVGAGGSIEVERPHLFGYEIQSSTDFYYFILIILLIGTYFALNLFRTHIGRAFIAVRDRDIAAEIIGINIFSIKLTAFAISSFYAGVAGVLYTYYYSVANYEAFTLVVSIQFLAMIIIGGTGSVLGSFLGAAFISLLPIVLDISLRSIGSIFGVEESSIAAVTTNLQLMLYGGLIMFFLVVEPDGLRKLWRNITDYFRVWPFPYT